MYERQQRLDAERPRRPDREPEQAPAAQAPGRQTRVAQLDPAWADRLGFDDYRVLALREVLGALGEAPELHDATIASADRDVARRALPALRPPPPPSARPAPGAAAAGGHAMWRAAERRATTLYRRACDGDEVSADAPAVEAALARAGGGAPLPDDVRRRMEEALGVSLDRVRVHTDAVAGAAARAVHAEAFTVGEDIFFAEGAFSPGSPAGQKLLAHELAHVLQGWQGRTGRGGAGPRVSRPGDALEQEADAIAERIEGGTPAGAIPEARERPAAAPAAPQAGDRAPAAGAPIQRKVKWGEYFNDFDDDPPFDAPGFYPGRWMEFQAARNLYSRADHSLREHGSSLLDIFEAEPNVTLFITSRDKMPPRHAGNTSLEFMDGSEKVFVDPDTAKRWGPLASGGAHAIITVALDSRGSGGQAAHTLNHEMSMHATEFLKYIRKVRAKEGDPKELADRYLGMHHEHHKKIHKPGQRLNVTHDKMLELAEGHDRVTLEEAYFEDKEQTSPDGYTEEEPRQGHKDGERWEIPRLSASSPVHALKIGEEQTLIHKRVRIRVKRTGEKTFQIWCAANQVKPYNAVVLVVEE